MGLRFNQWGIPNESTWPWTILCIKNSFSQWKHSSLGKNLSLNSTVPNLHFKGIMTDPKSGPFLLNASLPRHAPPSPTSNTTSPSPTFVSPSGLMENKTQITLNPSALPTSSSPSDRVPTSPGYLIPQTGLRFTVEQSGTTTKSQLIQDEDEDESRDQFDGVRSRNFGYPNGGREKRGRRSSSFSRSSIRRRLSSSRNSFKSLEIGKYCILTFF